MQNKKKSYDNIIIIMVIANDSFIEYESRQNWLKFVYIVLQPFLNVFYENNEKTPNIFHNLTIISD